MAFEETAMKYFRIVLFMLIALMSFNASATTWYFNGVLYGNICRSGYYYTVYPIAYGQPVGSQCPIRDQYGNFVMWGLVSNE